MKKLCVILAAVATLCIAGLVAVCFYIANSGEADKRSRQTEAARNARHKKPAEEATENLNSTSDEKQAL